MSASFRIQAAEAAQRISRRRMLAAGWGALGLLGCETRRETTTAFRVAGPSMAPTFWGPSVQFRCAACSITLRVDAEHWRAVQPSLNSSGNRAGSIPRCWHCGTPIHGESISVRSIAADVVIVRPSTAVLLRSQLAANETPVVVLKHGGKTHLKRVLAAPGQKVTSDDSGNLLVDGQLPSPSGLPRVPIDIDQRRTGIIASRWSCSDDSVWQRDANGNWNQVTDANVLSPDLVWLTYEHRNVYRGNVVSRVLDDCPANLGLDRRLHPVSRLGISIRLRVTNDAVESTGEASRPVGRQVRAVVWTDRGTRVISKQLPEPPSRGYEHVHFEPRVIQEGRPIEETGLDQAVAAFVSASSPVAIGWNPRSISTLSDLRLWRPVQWYVRSISSWTLADDEWFVVGDNAPVSIDSRDWGPVRTDQIIGVCDPIARDQPTDIGG
ncbi:MAG: S26 family signal peptidase [Rhodopirellula sp. JB055]|uniref:S26 family signal peptidase n=1 Tax=Rhodopirellula sp. JB055 TaxID=3342846 RepID=UPI003709C63D